MAITAQAIVKRIQQKLGTGWRDSSVDTFVAGNPDGEVKGVVTTYAPSLEVLHKAVAAGKNMIISLENPYYTRPAALTPGGTSPTGDQEGPPGYHPVPPAAAAGGRGGRGGGRGGEGGDTDPLIKEKRDYIAANNIVVYRLFENWTARQPDPQLGALIKALGWEKNYKPTEGVPWAARHAAFMAVPPATLKATAQNIKKTLKSGTIRIIGEPDTRVSKAAVSHGISLLVDLERYFAEPGVDLVIMGEAIWENEGMQYVADIVALGQKKGLILLGEEVSQEPGCGEMAAWLKSFVSEVPVEWIPAGDPTWMPTVNA
jgi:putative NIF3 family GTP cyclohydrolase 1 type 2